MGLPEPSLGSLATAAVAVLETSDPEAKARSGIEVRRAWIAGQFDEIGKALPPDRPARPELPPLRPPRDVPKRKINRGTAGRIALLHAIAHIELNAIDLAFDIVARFSGESLPKAFIDDWISVAGDECRHFLMLSERLTSLGGAYGDLPAHDGLWQAAMETAHDLAARLAVVPLVLEARGLDVTPGMIARLRAVEDDDSADMLQIIFEEEITHVAAGKRWFDHVAGERDVDPVALWRDLVRRYFRGGIKPPFNVEARAAAGFPAAFYGSLGQNHADNQN